MGQDLLSLWRGRDSPFLPTVPLFTIIYPHSIQISHLAIASSQVELVEARSVDVFIQNASATFKGTLNYGYKGAWG